MHKNGEGSSSRISSTIQSETYYYARKLSDGRYLRLSSKGLSIWSGFVQVLPALTGIALFVIFITFLIAHFLTRNIVEAINGIDLENPMEQLVFPELGVLQKRLGFQNRKIQTQMQNMKEQEYKLTAITENMNEGLIMLDADRKIQYMNQSCQDLFEVSGSKFIGQTISGFCDSIPMQEVVESALKGNVHTAMQELDHKKVQYFGNPILENQKIQGIIILVLDITERERTERMRKEFSANVSHELKTPLTSISGFAELMENHLVAPEDVPEFAAKIHRESERYCIIFRKYRGHGRVIPDQYESDDHSIYHDEGRACRYTVKRQGRYPHCSHRSDPRDRISGILSENKTWSCDPGNRK